MKQSSSVPQPGVDAPSSCGEPRRRRREKMLDAGDLRLLVLHFLSHSPAHGYELIKSIEDLSGGEYSPSPGMIYPALTLLEETQQIAVLDVQAARKAYRLLPEGQATLQQQAPLLAQAMQRLASLAVLVHNRRLPEIERAIHNFKTALNGRLAQPGISRQTLYAIVDALDDAAKKIERSE